MNLVIKVVPVHMIRSFGDLSEIQQEDNWLFDVRYVLFMLDHERDSLLYSLAKSSKKEGYDYMYLKGAK